MKGENLWMDDRFEEVQEYDFGDNEFYHPHELTKKEKAERAMLIATILLSALIIFCTSILVIVLVILDPNDVAATLEQEGAVNLAELMKEVANALSGG